MSNEEIFYFTAFGKCLSFPCQARTPNYILFHISYQLLRIGRQTKMWRS